jgi:hypothetical protein
MQALLLLLNLLDLKDKISDFICNGSPEGFDQLAEQLFEFQVEANPILKEFHSLVKGKLLDSDHSFTFLPIEFFKTRKVLCSGVRGTCHFESSGTTGTLNSRHYYDDLYIYEQSVLACFQRCYGDPADHIVLALLPGYTNRGNASLVYMMKTLIERSKNRHGSFFTNDNINLNRSIEEAERSGKKIFLIGVTFALLDLARDQPADLSGHIVMETGGMKGRSKEIIREEVHGILKSAFNANTIHSEYGMTELFSQAYSSGNGIFELPHWLKVVITETHDPFAVAPHGITGRINIIDLANIHSCAFIATDDLGISHPDGTFEVMGRMDNSSLRGCNLMSI